MLNQSSRHVGVGTLALTVAACLIVGCGANTVPVAGGSAAPPPKTERAKKAADAEDKIIKSSKLR